MRRSLPEEVPKWMSYYADFDSYAKDYPEGESYRAWLTCGGRDNVMLFLIPNVHDNGMPGHYLAATLREYVDGRDKTKQTRYLQLTLHDSDDGIAIRLWPVEERAQAEQVLADMMQLAPFTMSEAVAVFGLRHR